MFLKVLQPIINFIMAAFVGLFLLNSQAFAKVGLTLPIKQPWSL